jgi:hypothetical protein
VTSTQAAPGTAAIDQRRLLVIIGALLLGMRLRLLQQGLTRLLGSWSADLDAQLAGRIQQLTRDILHDPARRHQLLAALAPAPTATA